MRPLEGIKIVEMASVVAAPITSRLLSDYGADVIKIESLKGDDLRSAGKSYNLPCDDDFNPLFTLANTNKENICIDAKNDVGREIIIKLIQSADVFITNICYDSLKRLRLDYDSIKSICPSIIYAYFSGYGMYGPERSKPGFDVTAFWLRNGAMLDWKDHNSFIMNPSYAFGDMATSSTFLSGILMAIVGRMSTGQGTFVTTSLQACGIWYNMCDILSSQPPFNRQILYDQLHQTDPFSAIYKCKDDKYIGIFCNDYCTEKAKFSSIFGITELLDDERCKSPQELHASGMISTIIMKMNDILLTKTSNEWATILTTNNISFEIARCAYDVHNDQQALANEYIEQIVFDNGKKVSFPAPPIQYDEYTRRNTTPSVKKGEHTKEILSSLNYSEQQIEKMFHNNIVK